MRTFAKIAAKAAKADIKAIKMNSQVGTQRQDCRNSGLKSLPSRTSPKTTSSATTNAIMADEYNAEEVRKKLIKI